MIEVSTAKQRVLEHTKRLSPSFVSVHESLLKVLASDIKSSSRLPEHDVSLMDGYVFLLPLSYTRYRQATYTGMRFEI